MPVVPETGLKSTAIRSVRKASPAARRICAAPAGFDNRSQPRIDRRCRGNQRDVSELQGGDEAHVAPTFHPSKNRRSRPAAGQRRKQGQQALPLRRKIISCRLGGGFAASAAEWIDQKDASPQQPGQPLKLPPIGQKTWQKQNWRRIGAVVGHRRELKKARQSGP